MKLPLGDVGCNISFARMPSFEGYTTYIYAINSEYKGFVSFHIDSDETLDMPMDTRSGAYGGDICRQTQAKSNRMKAD